MKRAWRMVAAAVLLGGVVACDAAEQDEQLDWEANQTMRDTLPGSAGEPTTGPEAALTATLTEWNIRLARDTVTPGPTTVRVRNIGEYRHAFELEGNGSEWVVQNIAPGEWATLQVDLEPGTYEVYCPLDDEHGNHQQQGMVAYLVVREGGRIPPDRGELEATGSSMNVGPGD